MNLVALRTQLQTMGYGTDTATQQTAALNDAYRQVCGNRRWTWLEGRVNAAALTAGTSNYSLGSITDLLSVDAIRLTFGSDNYELSHKPTQELRELVHNDRATGVPRFWTRHIGEVVYWPIPDRAYVPVIDYIKDPADLAADGDTPIFPATFHDILVWGAVKNAAFRQRDWNSHTVASTEYANRLRDMKQADGIPQRQRPGQVRHSRFWDT